MTRRRAVPLELDSQIRSAEDDAYSYYGLSRTVKRLVLDTTAGQVDVRVSAFDGPTDQTPVVLLHGIGSAHVLAAPLIRFLGGRQVVAVDWPAHGLSGPKWPRTSRSSATLPPHSQAMSEAGSKPSSQ